MSKFLTGLVVAFAVTLVLGTGAFAKEVTVCPNGGVWVHGHYVCADTGNNS